MCQKIPFLRDTTLEELSSHGFNWGRSPSFCDGMTWKSVSGDLKSFNWGRSPSFCDWAWHWRHSVWEQMVSIGAEAPHFVTVIGRPPIERIEQFVSIGAEAPHFVTFPRDPGFWTVVIGFNWGRSPSFCDVAAGYSPGEILSFNWGRSPSFCDDGRTTKDNYCLRDRFNWGRSPSFCDVNISEYGQNNAAPCFNWGRSPSFCDWCSPAAVPWRMNSFQLGPKPLIL